MSFTAEHADALALVRENGAAVTFTRTALGAHVPASGTFGGPSQTTVAGVAIRTSPTQAERDRYRAASLTIEKVVTLLFVASTYGQMPAVNDRVTWRGEALTVRDVGPLDLDGEGPILCRVGCTP